NRFFDNYDARKRRFRSVSSIFFCQEEVEASFAEYRLAQVGGDAVLGDSEAAAGTTEVVPAATDEAFSKPVLLEFLARSERELHAALSVAEQSGQDEMAGSIERACGRLSEINREIEGAARPDTQAIERDLDAIDRLLLESARRALGEEGVADLRTEGEA